MFTDKLITIWNNTIIVKNNIDNVGIRIDGGSSGGLYNFFGGNTISQDQGIAILVNEGSYNAFYGNVVRDYSLSDYCVELYYAYSNLFFGNSLISDSNNFVNNQVGPLNNFDDGLMGNYWGNYSGTGVYRVYNDVVDNFPLLESPGVLTDIPSLSGPWQSIHPVLNSGV